MKEFFRKFLITVGVSLAAVTSAQAATYNLGTLTSAPTLQNVYQPSGPVNDRFDFSLSGPGVAGAGASAANLTLPVGSLNLTFTDLKIYNNSNQLLFTANPSGNVLSWSGNLVGGAYYAIITGMVTGSLGGYYTFSAHASPVPLPPAAWLLGAGLVGLVAIARRKRNDLPGTPSVAA